jgi:ferredoxin
MNMDVLLNSRPAKYHVNQRCIGCRICSAIAPRNFRSDHERGVDYVYKQPTSLEEERLCAEVMDICPVNAIDRRAT